MEGGGPAKRGGFRCSLLLLVGSAGSSGPAPTLWHLKSTVLDDLRKQLWINRRFTEIMTFGLEVGGTAKRAGFRVGLVLPVGSAGSSGPAPTL